MWRILFYLAILCAAALGAVWIANLPGEITVSVLGQQASPPLSVAVALLLAAGFVIAFAWWLIMTLIRLPFRIGHASRVRRHSRGIKALSRGMIAVGAGDTGQARRHAREAQRLLGEEPLTLLLNAQVAQAAGDAAAAEAAFRKMADTKDTRLIGLRGLFIEARRQGDHQAAFRHAREAVQLAPSAAWANDAVLETQCVEGAWDEALTMIDKRVSLGLISRETAKRQRAVLLTADALAHQQTASEKALNDVRKALKYAPTLAPAALLAGRLLSARSEVRKAAKIIERAWVAEPHPDLANLYIHLRYGDSATDRLKRAEVLGQLCNWKPEARLALAGAALDAREFKRAREALAPLVAEHPTIRVCLMMADVEQAEHGASGLVREWVARAARAPRDPAWMADGAVFEHWAPFSPVTGQLDAFRWQSPPDTLALSNMPDLELERAAQRQAEEPARVIDHKPHHPAKTEEVHAPVAEAAPLAPAPVEEKLAPAPEKMVVAEKEVAPVQEAAAPVASAPTEEPAAAPEEGKSPEAAPAAADATPMPEPAEEGKKLQAAAAAVSAPKPVVFPVVHAPDDPGVEKAEPKAKR